jgi:hypothetical protein
MCLVEAVTYEERVVGGAQERHERLKLMRLDLPAKAVRFQAVCTQNGHYKSLQPSRELENMIAEAKP